MTPAMRAALFGRRAVGGGGGGGIPEGLAIWLDASDSASQWQDLEGASQSVPSGSGTTKRVARIDNKGTLGGFATTDTGDLSRSPLLVSGSGATNDLPYVDFGGNGEYWLYELADAIPLPISWYLVKKRVNFGLTNAGAYFSSQPTDDAWRLMRIGGGNLIFGNGSDVVIHNPDTTDYEVVSASAIPTGTGATAIYINGEAVVGNPSGSNSLESLLIGMNDPAVAGSGFTHRFQFMELRMYVARHDVDTQAATAATLIEKWGVSP